MACGILLGVFEGVGVLIGRIFNEGNRPQLPPRALPSSLFSPLTWLILFKYPKTWHLCQLPSHHPHRLHHTSHIVCFLCRSASTSMLRYPTYYQNLNLTSRLLSLHHTVIIILTCLGICDAYATAPCPTYLISDAKNIFHFELASCLCPRYTIWGRT